MSFITNGIRYNLGFDMNGNVIIAHNSIKYTLDISRNNTLETFELSHTFDLEETKEFIKLENKKQMLKEKVEEELKKERENDSDYEDDEVNRKNLETICPEDLFFNIVDKENYSGNNEVEIYTDGSYDKLLTTKGLNDPPIYDVYVRNNLGDVVFSMKNQNINNYRVILYIDNESIVFELNIIGEKIAKYNMMIKDEKLFIEQQ